MTNEAKALLERIKMLHCFKQKKVAVISILQAERLSPTIWITVYRMTWTSYVHKSCR